MAADEKKALRQKRGKEMKRLKLFLKVYFKFIPVRHRNVIVLAGPIHFGPFENEAELKQWKTEFLDDFIEAFAEEGWSVKILKEETVERRVKQRWARKTKIQRVGKFFAFFQKMSLMMPMAGLRAAEKIS